MHSDRFEPEFVYPRKRTRRQTHDHGPAFVPVSKGVLPLGIQAWQQDLHAWAKEAAIAEIAAERAYGAAWSVSLN